MLLAAHPCVRAFPFLLFVAFTLTALPQAPAPVIPQPEKQGVVQSSELVKLPASTDVNSNVTVDAALLPYRVSRRIFGTEIAKRYAVIQLVISNHDASNSMIVQSVLLDYSHWLFSGNFAALGTPQPAEGLGPYRAANLPSEVASAESRLVRAELQDAQQWTARNWTIRTAILIGTTAAGFQFLFGENYSKGADSFNGSLIPGLQQLWPDASLSQINRISDFGFTTNHVIPKNASDVIVAFFPLDRFLTPDLQELYKNAPAAFFNPGEMLIDKTYNVKLLNLLRLAGVLDTPVTPEKDKKQSTPERVQNRADSKKIGTTLKHYELFKLQNHLPAHASDKVLETYQKTLAKACENTDPARLTGDDCLLLTMLNKVSLNNIRVVAGGVMTVDTNKVPGSVTDIKFTDNPTLAANWTGPVAAGGTQPKHNATLLGTFLGGGQVSVTAIDSKGTAMTSVPLENTATDSQNSDDNHIAFSYTLAKAIDPGMLLRFTVTKAAKDGSTTQSAPFSFPVSYTAPGDATSKVGNAAAAVPVVATVPAPALTTPAKAGKAAAKSKAHVINRQ